MKSKILSVIGGILIFGSLIGNTVTAQASIAENVIDGSVLTKNESSVGTTQNNTRGVHLMDGECSISKAGTKRIYTYGATTANHTVDNITVIVYVDQYNETEKQWEQIDAWAKQGTDDYFICTSKSITVDRGYYYRVHADHVVKQGEEYEETFSYTDGILVPK